MTVQDHSGHRNHAPGGTSQNIKAGLVLLGFLFIAGVLLFTEHRAHVLGFLVWLPLLACPLMHLFMHGSGNHGSGGHSEDGGR